MFNAYLKAQHNNMIQNIEHSALGNIQVPGKFFKRKEEKPTNGKIIFMPCEDQHLKMIFKLFLFINIKQTKIYD